MRYEDENIWLTQKMLATLYNVEVHNRFIQATDHNVLMDAGKVTAEIAKAHAESEFEKYRIIQDSCFNLTLIN